MGWSGHLTGVLIVAVVVLGPVWLSLHYRARQAAWRGGDELSRKLDELADLAGRLQARVDVLERLLDMGTDGRGPDDRRREES